jgi:hypothetical protein
MPESSLKAQAQEIMTAVGRDLAQLDQAAASTALTEVDSKANALVNTLFGVISDVDLQAATARVEKLREVHPQAASAELAQLLTREKCRRTGTVGAVTSGAGLIPGLGTAAALTLGVAADIGATFKLQAELVLEIAAVYNYPLTEQEKQHLVMFITGLSAGASALTRKAGQAAAVKIGEKVAERTIQKSVLKALPVVGVIASAGTNALSTYVIGQRADAYFRLGPEAVGNWADSLRAVTGLDERNLTTWLADNSRAAGIAISAGVEKAGEAGKAAGVAVAAGAQKAGQTAGVGLRAYFHWVVGFWRAVFRLVGGAARRVWVALMFLPRKITRLFGRGK